VVDCRGDEDWQALCAVINRPDLAADPGLATAPGRLARHAAIEQAVADWTVGHEPRKAMELLQQSGVPAGAMLRVVDLLDDPQLAARDFFSELRQPTMAEPLPTEARPAVSRHLADPPLNPAPFQSEHTRELARELLNLTEPEIDALVAGGALEEMERNA